MNAAGLSTDVSAITLWVLNRNGNEVRCVVDAAARGRWTPFERGTARMLVDGAVVDRQVFSNLNELLEVTTNWGHRIAAVIGG